MVLIIVILAVAFLLVVLPQLWIHRIMDRHAAERADIAGTGGEFARHALDQLKLYGVKVEQTEMGSHYDPISRTVRLEPRFMSGRSLSAIVVAAHEVGHAMQHAMNLPMFERRIRVAEKAHIFSMVAAGFLFAAPLLMLIGKTPMALVINVVGIVGSILLSLMTQIVTLPVEFDASFNRALPLLQKGRYIKDEDMPAARSLLRAAAYTYVAGLLRTLIQIPGLGRIPRI
ncbi:MAG: zinc metallopeptidase [Hyphomicrobiales bacterium]|nr:zinc metallopeptidase [Hyphomicrobiales bacterium]